MNEAYLQPGQSIQREQTSWTDGFTDQHGRRFEAQFDNRNQRPKEELRPVGFHPPWLPPMRYITWERDGSFNFRWDYETMANDLSGDATTFYAQVFEFMTEHMPGVEPPELGEPVPTKILRSPIGKPPLSPAVPLACLAGDPWMLGTPGAPVNQMLKDIIEQSATANGRQALQVIRAKMQAIVGDNGVKERVVEADPRAAKVKSITDIDVKTVTAVTYNEFAAEARKAGMAMAQISLAWAKHKEFVALEQVA